MSCTFHNFLHANEEYMACPSTSAHVPSLQLAIQCAPNLEGRFHYVREPCSFNLNPKRSFPASFQVPLVYCRAHGCDSYLRIPIFLADQVVRFFRLILKNTWCTPVLWCAPHLFHIQMENTLWALMSIGRWSISPYFSFITCPLQPSNRSEPSLESWRQQFHSPPKILFLVWFVSLACILMAETDTMGHSMLSTEMQ